MKTKLFCYSIITCKSEKHVCEYSFKRCYWLSPDLCETIWDSPCFFLFWCSTDHQEMWNKFLPHLPLRDQRQWENSMEKVWAVRGGLGWDVFSWCEDCGATISISSLIKKKKQPTDAHTEEISCSEENFKHIIHLYKTLKTKNKKLKDRKMDVLVDSCVNMPTLILLPTIPSSLSSSPFPPSFPPLMDWLWNVAPQVHGLNIVKSLGEAWLVS